MKQNLLIILISLQSVYYLQAQMFTEQKNYFPELAWGSIAHADFDLDGDQDLLICGRNTQNLAVTKIYRNENGRFIDIKVEIENVMLSSVIWDDFNNDKYPDILISGKNNKGEAVTIMYRNWKNGTFKAVEAVFAGVSSPSVAAADYDKDGDLDLLITGRTKTAAISKIYKNNGYFIFEETDVKLTGVYNSAVAWADFNNDSYPDILISGESGFNRYTKVYLNGKDGSFSESYTELPQLGSSAVVCADFNLDDNIDILLSGLDVYGNERTELFVNDGNFSLTNLNKKRAFKQLDYVLPNIAYGTINAVDIDGDKDLDLIFTGKGSRKIASVYLNDGSFNFKKLDNDLTAVYHSALSSFDADGDHKPDIFYMGLNEDDQLVSKFYKNKGMSALNKTSQKQKIQQIKPDFNFSMITVGKPTKFVNQTKSTLNKPVAFNWNFGDGASSTTDSPTHTYSKEGRYTVVLTARVDDQIETYTKTIYVKPEQTQVIRFTDREMLVLNLNALELLRDYEMLVNNLGSVSGTDEKETADLKEQIINLFLNRQIVVYNDLDPTGKTSKLKEIETYSSDLILKYPDGISVEIDFDRARMTSVRQHGKSLYSVDIITTKRIDGNYNNKMQNANTDKLAFRVAFNKGKSGFTNFKFVGIRNYYEQSFVSDEKSMEEINKAAISKSQLEQIDNASHALLNDYIRNLSLLGSQKEDDEDKIFYEEAFVELFADSAAQLYNDIDPESKENSFLPADYIKTYRLVYPSGINNINLNLDSALYKPVLEDNGIYYRYVYADKNFSGEYKAKLKNSVLENLAFKLVFKKQENSFQNFKISSIDQSALNFYQSENMALVEDTTTYIIRKINRNGFSVGISITGGLGTIYNENVIAEELGRKNIWKVQPEISYSGGIELNYFFTNNLALQAGVLYSSYKTTYSIDGQYSDGDNTSLDLNGESFIKHLNAISYSSQISLSNIDIPIQIHWVSSDARKIGLFIKIGANLSIPIGASQTNNGSLDYYGYYPDHPVAIEELYIEELGFYSISPNKENGIYTTAPYTLSLIASAGVNIPIGYFTSIQFGPELLWGVTNLTNSNTYTNIFGTETDNLGTTLRNYGFNISVNYKF